MKRITIILLFMVCCDWAVAQHRLWYDRPAQTWTQALPVGNGVIGGMVFGTPAVEHIALNEETIWAGQPNNVINPNAKAALPEVRRLIFEGKYKEAQDLANAKVMPNAAGQNMGMPYQPFGDLFISMPGHADYKNYERWLDLDNAKSIVHYEVDGVKYEREVITPLGGNHVMAIHLTASEKGKITFTANMTTPHENPLIGMDGNEATLLGVSSKHEGLKGKVRFMGRMAVQTKGGRTTGSNGNISVVGADEATIYVAIGTNVKNYKDITGDEEVQSKERLHVAMALGYEALKAQHEKEYHKYYDRVKLDLGSDLYANVPMNKRIERFSVVSDSVADNNLVATYFQFGRYLLICSSQPDNMNPANLQGIWNEKMFPSWDSKYTTNINVQAYPRDLRTGQADGPRHVWRGRLGIAPQHGPMAHHGSCGSCPDGSLANGGSMALQTSVGTLPLHGRQGFPAPILSHHARCSPLLYADTGEASHKGLAGGLSWRIA